MAARAGRLTPSIMPMTMRALVQVAPVLPADRKASARPSATRFAQIRTEELRFMALRTGGKRLRFEEVVGTARARAGLGMASFWIRHWRVAPELVIGYRLSVIGSRGTGNRQQTTAVNFPSSSTARCESLSALPTAR